jgi:SAM-dependent methyltransferase
MMSDRARATAVKYRGPIAHGYEAKRVGQPKWAAENAAVGAVLRRFPPGTTVLDIPVGTGRFLPLYADLGLSVTGLDISKDMLRIARDKGHGFDLRTGDIFAIDMPDKSVDVAVSIRIMNLIGPDDMARALGELQRVARRSILFNLRIWTPGTRFRHTQRAEILDKSLQPGWRIEGDTRLHEPDFRLFHLSCSSCSG